jgi:VPDSG-CTERM motif
VSWTAAVRNSQQALTGLTHFTFLVGAHDIHYELDVSYAGVLAPGDEAGFLTSLGDRDNKRRGFVSLFNDFTPILDGGPFHFSFSSSGTLCAGNTIYFTHISSLYGLLEEDGGRTPAAVATGFWNLRLTEIADANHVPDAGSTLTMLGMALGGLGFIRRS